MNALRNYSTLIIVVLGIFCLLGSCVICDESTLPKFNGQTFSIENCDDDTIYLFHFNSNLDFMVTPEYLMRNEAKLTEIAPNQIYGDFPLGYLNMSNPDKNTNWTHQILIFRKETLEKYSKQEIAERNIYDAYYVLPTQEILDMGKIVQFPLNKGDKSGE